MRKRIRTARWIRYSAGLFALVLVGSLRTRSATAKPQAGAKPCGTVTVAAASDLTYAMNEIAANFQKATGCTVRLSLGSSGNFLTQIENGAPFDVFFLGGYCLSAKTGSRWDSPLPEARISMPSEKLCCGREKDSRVDVTQGFFRVARFQHQKDRHRQS